jgi:signal transduction histidine kinase/ActR/RegA family two-component response regulator
MNHARAEERPASAALVDDPERLRRRRAIHPPRRRMLVLGDAAFARELETAAGELCSTLLVADDASVALEWLARAPVDLCFIDVDRLGGSTSDTVTLLARVGARADLVLAVHPHAAAVALSAMRAGATDVLSRPLASVDVEDCVGRSEGRRARAAAAAIAAASLEVHAASHARMPRAAAKAALACLGADGATLLVMGPDGTLAPAAGEVTGPGSTPELLELAHRAAAATRAEVVSGWRDHDPQQGGMPTLHGRASGLVVPLVADGKVLGVLTATRNALRPPYVREDLELASRLGEHVAVALQKSRFVRDVAQAARAGAAGQLAASMVHEVNNPLSCILGNLEFAREKLRELAARGPGATAAGTEGVLQSLADAERGALRIMDVVTDIRVMSHCEDSAPSIFDVSDAVRSALRVAGAQLEATSSVSAELEPLRVRGNPGQLTQVVLSLLLASEGAMHGVAREQRALRISSWRDGDRAVLRITDTGPVIAEASLAHIFEPFAEDGGERRGGLGLCLSRDVVARHGGSLLVGSGDGGGAVFTVLLPLADREARARRRDGRRGRRVGRRLG